MSAETATFEQLLMLYALNYPGLAEAHAEELAGIVFADRELDKLRQELLVTLSSGQALDPKGLRDHLAGSGFAEMVARLEASHVLKPAWSAWPGASLAEAEIGWRHVLARLRRLALRREIAAAEAAYRERGSDEMLMRLIELKREFDRSEGTEAEVEGYVFRS